MKKSDKYKFTGTVKVSSSMDQNTYTILDKNGQFVGTLSITNQKNLSPIEQLFLKQLEDPFLLQKEKDIKGGMTLNLSMEFSIQ